MAAIAPNPPPGPSPIPGDPEPVAGALPPAEKPYVGPRTFRPNERERFFGRDREARDLVARIVAERFTLFYAQSGAGKSSLINTRIIPGLEAEGFEVLPVARVSGHGGAEIAADNIFVYNLLAGLHQRDEPPPGLATMTVGHFLDNLVGRGGEFFYDDAYEWPADAELKPRVLIIDQFEEIITTNNAFWAQREPFFRQLGQALEADDSLWVVLALREDFLANLDPYLHLVNHGVRQRYYMQHLDRDAALLAICRPVENIRPFEEGAAEALLNNLLMSRRPADGGQPHPAEFVEPVQLQAVCYQMWEKLQTRPGPTITCQDVEDFADVDTALVSFYEDTIADTMTWAAAQPDLTLSEIDLRHWFDAQLVTEAGTRNMVFRGREVTGDLPTAVADYIKSRFILREVVRPGGGVWYELVHDRFIQPIREANRKWFQNQPLLQLAEQWAAAGHSEALLLTGSQLDEFSNTKWEALGPVVAEFMAASGQGQEARERRRRVLQWAAAAVVFVALLGAAAFLTFTVRRLSVLLDERDAAAAALAESQRDLEDRNVTLLMRQNELTEAGAKLDAANAELSAAYRDLQALRLADTASDYLAQGRLDTAILLSYQALQAVPDAPPARVRSVLFDALDRKLALGDVTSPLRGFYASPVDESGAPLSLGQVIPGPAPGSLAAVVDGNLWWWVPSGDAAPVAGRVVFPGDYGAPIGLAAFDPAGGLLLTAPAVGTGARLWRVDETDAAEAVTDVIPADTVTALAVSGNRLAVASCRREEADGECGRGTIAVWEVSDDAIPAELVPPIQTDIPVVALAFANTAAGERLAWTDSYTVALESLDPTSGERVHLPTLSVQPTFRGLAAAPDDQQLIVTGCDKPATLEQPLVPQLAPVRPVECDAADPAWIEWWSLAGENPAGSRSDTPALLQPAYLPDRQVVVLRTTDGRLSFRSTSLDTARAEACRVAGRNLTAAEWLDVDPEGSLDAYEPVCAEYPAHPSVIAALINRCLEADEAAGCWSTLETMAGAPVPPDAVRAAGERIAAARAEFGRQRRTATLRALAEASQPLAAMASSIRTALEDDILALYGQICTDGLQTDSPAVAEACSRGRDLAFTGDEVQLDAEADRPAWRFEGRAGDVVTVAATALEGGDPTLTFLNARGEHLAYNDDFNGLNPQLTLQLTEDGPYRVLVDWLGSPGAYNLRISRQAPAPLTIGVPVEDSGERRLWYVDGRAGDLLEVSAAEVTGDAWLRLSDAEYNQLLFNDQSGNSAGPRLSYLLPADGRYVVEVGWNGAPGPYSLSATVGEVELLPLGETREDVDPADAVWRFEGRAGDYVTLVAEAADLAADLNLRLLDPHGVELLYRDDYYAGAIEPQREQIEQLLREDGIYTLEVGWLSEVTPYTLTTRRAEAEPLAPGEHLIGPEQRLWRIDGRAGDHLLITARPDAEQYVYLNLYDAAFSPLSYVDSTFDAPAPQLSYLLTEDGEYWLELGWFTGYAPGQARLTFSSAVAEPLAAGESRAGDQDQRLWRYDGRAGEILRFSVDSDAEGGAWLRLMDDQLVELTSANSFSGAPLALSYGFAADQTLFIEVGANDATVPHAYTLSVAPVTPEPLLSDQPVAEVGPETAFWAYEARAGDYVRFTARALDGSDPWLSLRDASFAEVAYSYGYAGQPDPQLAYQFPAAGVYVLEVGWDGAPGPFSLNAAPLQPEPLPLALEVGADAAATAAPAFQGRAGDLVSLTLDAPDGRFTWVQLRDAQFGEVAFEYAQESDVQMVAALPQDGPYLVEVGWEGAPDAYSLRVDATEAAPLPARQSIAAGGQSSWVFIGREGDVLAIAAAAGDDGDMNMSLYDSQFRELAFSDDFEDLDPRITVRLPADGVYTLQVGWQDWAEQFGPYELIATPLESEPLVLGQTVEATADRRLWRISGRAGDTISLAVQGPVGSNPWLQLLNDRFERIAFSDNADGDGLNPRLSLQLPETGEYFLEVGWFGEPPEEPYRLTAE